MRSQTHHDTPATAASVLMFVLLLSAALLGAPAEATADVSLGLATTLVQLEAIPGELVQTPITVFNDGETTLTVAASATDFSFDAHGRAVPRPASSGPSSWSAASWIDIGETGFTLAPGQETEVWVCIEPPEGAEPGTHQALIVFQGTPMTDQTGIVVRPNVALMTLTTIPGDVVDAPTLDIGFPSVVFNDPSADAVLGNDGTGHYFATGKVTWLQHAEPCGECEPELPAAGVLVLPGMYRSVPVSWPEAPLFGVFDVQAEFTTADGRLLSADDRFLLIRWQLIASVAAVLATVGAAVHVRRRYRLVPREPDDAT